MFLNASAMIATYTGTAGFGTTPTSAFFNQQAVGETFDIHLHGCSEWFEYQYRSDRRKRVDSQRYHYVGWRFPCSNYK